MFMQFLFDSIRLGLRAIALTALLLFSLSWVLSICTVDPVNGPTLSHLAKVQSEHALSEAAPGSGPITLAADIDYLDIDDKFYVLQTLTMHSLLNARTRWHAFQLPPVVRRHYLPIDVPIS
jgi:hypothetical protein